jgi:hypothetical protein
MLICVLAFILGTVLGIFIMTQIDKEKERKLMDQLLELEDNVSQLRNLKDAYKSNQCKCKND